VRTKQTFYWYIHFLTLIFTFNLICSHFHIKSQEPLPRSSAHIINIAAILHSEFACPQTRKTYQPDITHFPGKTPAPFDDTWHWRGLIVIAEITQRCRNRVQTHVKAVT
jgi:hypothetical protein